MAASKLNCLVEEVYWVKEPADPSPAVIRKLIATGRVRLSAIANAK
jgi:hypothetical protein